MSNRLLKRSIFGQGGITLVEVIVSIAIFSIIIGGTGRFIVFSLNSWNQIQTTSNAISRVSNAVLVMEKEVRQAKMPSYEQNAVSVFDGLNGTEPIENGSRVDIYTDYHAEMTRITYLVYDNAFYRIETNLSEDPPNSPDDLVGLMPVIPLVRNIEDSDGNPIPIFEVAGENNNQLKIRFEVVNKNGQEDSLFEVNTSYTVRLQGVM